RLPEVSGGPDASRRPPRVSRESRHQPARGRAVRPRRERERARPRQQQAGTAASLDRARGCGGIRGLARLSGNRKHGRRPPRGGLVGERRNRELVLERAGIADLVEANIDGDTVERESLRPKPAPDMLLSACARLGVAPAQTAAFETTPDGIVAARTAGIRATI